MKRSVSRSDMAQIQENFDKFCRRWGTNVWPDFSRNLTHSHYSRRHLDARSRLAVRQDNEERVVPVCEAVVTAAAAARGGGQKRLRACESVETAIERLAVSQQQWHELAAVQERMRTSGRANSAQLLTNLRDVVRRGLRARLAATQLDRDLAELRRTQEAAVARAVEAARLPSSSPSSSAAVAVAAGDEVEAWRAGQAEEARLETRALQQRAVESAALYDRRRRSSKRILDEAERTAVVRSHPELELFILEEKLIRDAYPQPPEARRRRVESGAERKAQRP